MRKLIYTIYILLSCLTTGWAQNLVPNPSFEAYKNIPCSWNTVPADFSSYVDYWYLPSNTSTDMHSTLADAGCWANPASEDESAVRLGHQQPHTGNNMIGLYTRVNTHSWHEYIQVKLLKPLVKGQTYQVEMWVSAGDNVSSASNNLGMLFTRDPIRGEDNILAKPQFNHGEVIREKEGWFLIQGTFVADDDAQYLTIGNFFSDSETIMEDLNDNYTSDGAYYFIDDIVVRPLPV